MSKKQLLELRIHKVTKREQADGSHLEGPLSPIMRHQIEFYREHEEVALISETPTMVTFRMPPSVRDECEKALGITKVPMPANDAPGVNAPPSET